MHGDRRAAEGQEGTRQRLINPDGRAESTGRRTHREAHDGDGRDGGNRPEPGRSPTHWYAAPVRVCVDEPGDMQLPDRLPTTLAPFWSSTNAWLTSLFHSAYCCA